MSNKTNSVIVLMPNGRRQTLKINLDDSILQILEEVCSKHGFKFDEFSLRHHNTILDPTSVIRFSGLPNNAFLEMVPSHRPSIAGGKVTLSLHIEGNNERVTGEFSSDSNLETILSQLSPNVITNSDKVPVIVYMRREVIGIEAFRSTTLRNLGLTSGRALLRVTFRDSEEHPDLKSTGVSVLISKKADQIEKSERRASTSSDSSSLRKPFYLSTKRPTFDSQPIPAAEIVTAVEIVQDVLNEAQLNEDAFNQPVPEIKEEMPSSSGRAHFKKSPSPSRKLASHAPKVGENVKSTSVNRPEINLSEVAFLEERNGLVFTLESSVLSLSQEVPDSFFDITVDDVKVLMKHLKQSREEMENAPLQTEALRKSQIEKRLRNYDNTVIRIQFPDRHVLQGVFSVNETVKDVVNFVRNYIAEPDTKFYLYTSPPKTVLDENNVLISIGCVPCGKMYFSFGDLEKVSDKFLSDKVLSFLTSQSTATYVACRLRGLLTEYTDPEFVDTSAPVNQQPSPTVNFEQLQSTSRNTSDDSNISKQRGKVPKWFKP